MIADTNHTFPLVRNLAILLGVWLAAAGLTQAVLLFSDIDGQTPAMLAAGLTCGVAAALAMLPMGLLSKRGGDDGRQSAVNGALIGLMVRLSLSLGGGALVGWVFEIGIRPVLAWTTGWYLLLLAAEVVVVNRYLAAAHVNDLPTSATTEGAAC